MTPDLRTLIDRLAKQAGLPVAISAHPGVKHLCVLLAREIAAQAAEHIVDESRRTYGVVLEEHNEAACMVRHRFGLPPR